MHIWTSDNPSLENGWSMTPYHLGKDLYQDPFFFDLKTCIFIENNSCFEKIFNFEEFFLS